MTNEEKQLLLKDLCARLPYGVMIEITSDGGIMEASHDMRLDAGLLADLLHSEDGFKPYLRPILSMTDDEKKSYHILKDRLCEVCIHGTIKDIAYWTNALDLWFYKYHFDNANLIEKGLALEAPGGMYNN